MRTTKKDRTLWNLNKAVMALQKDDDSWGRLMGRAVDTGIYELAKDNKIAFYNAEICDWPECYTEKKPIFVLAYKDDFDKAKAEDEHDKRYGIEPYHVRILLISIHCDAMRHEFR